MTTNPVQTINDISIESKIFVVPVKKMTMSRKRIVRIFVDIIIMVSLMIFSLGSPYFPTNSSHLLPNANGKYQNM